MGNGENGKTTLTFSSISSFKACPKKYYWRYVRELEALERPEALVLGTEIHRLLESFYRQQGYVIPDDLSNKSKAIMMGIQDYYPILYGEDFDLFQPIAVEKIIRGEILNPESGRPAREYAFSGKVDGVVQLKKKVEGFDVGSLLLLEHKSVSRVDEHYFDRLQLDSQLLLYSIYLERELKTPIQGVLFNVLVKPGIRPRKGEADEEFGKRLKMEMGWPEQYQRRYIHFPEHRLEDTVREIWNSKSIIAKARREEVFVQNANACFDYHRKCDYWVLCASQDPEAVIKESDLFRYQQAHSELIGASGEVLVEAAAEPF